MDGLQEILEEVQNETQAVPSRVENAPNGMSDELVQMQHMIQLDPSLAESEEFKNLLAELEKKESGSKGRIKPKNDDEEQEDADEETDEEEDEEDVENESPNPFTAEKKGKKTKEIEINFEIPSELNAVIEKNFGIKDVPTFFNSVQTWRTQAQEVKTKTEELDAIHSDFANLPFEIKMQIDAYYNGEDPLKVVQNITRLDYDLDFAKQDVEKLVQHYLPEEYDELIREFDKNEDFTEDELNKQIALLGKTTKRFFEEEKKAVKSQRDDYTKKVIEKQESFKNSGLVSVENLSKAYPDFSKTELNKVRSILVEGKLENLIYDSSGMYRDDVAERVAFMLYGKQIMENAEKKGVRKGESQRLSKL